MGLYDLSYGNNQSANYLAPPRKGKNSASTSASYWQDAATATDVYRGSLRDDWSRQIFDARRMNNLLEAEKFNLMFGKYLSPQPSYSSTSAGGGGNYYENRLKALMENPDSIQNSGAYRFAFDQGQQAIERSAAARGMLNSGNILAELARYGHGMASQRYDAESDRLSKMALGKEQLNIQEQSARDASRGRNLQFALEAYKATPKVLIA